MKRRDFLMTAVSPLIMTLRTPQITIPNAVISNGLIRATLHLPDKDKGFYRSTRFDWSGVVGSLEYAGHQYYGPWFTKSDPPLRDFVYRDLDIVAGAQSAITGPAEEFRLPQGYLAAQPGGTFVKIGVGVLRKADETNYSPFGKYELVDPGTWTVRTHTDSVEFAQKVHDPGSGYGYEYQKTVSLAPGRPELTIAHSLTNIGGLPIQTSQYNHNFLVLDGAATGPDFLITVPFPIQTTRPPDPAFAEIRGNTIAYVKMFEGEDMVSFPLQGFGSEAKDYDIRIENRRTGAGVRVTADRPLARLVLWSIRSTICMEPFIDVSTAPGDTTSWTLTYRYDVTAK